MVEGGGATFRQVGTICWCVHLGWTRCTVDRATQSHAINWSGQGKCCESSSGAIVAYCHCWLCTHWAYQAVILWNQVQTMSPYPWQRAQLCKSSRVNILPLSPPSNLIYQGQDGLITGSGKPNSEDWFLRDWCPLPSVHSSFILDPRIETFGCLCIHSVNTRTVSGSWVTLKSSWAKVFNSE